MADDFPNGWLSAAVTPDAPGWYERRYSDGTYVHHWNGSQWSATKDGNAHWRQLADAPYPLWRPIPALGVQALQANPVACQNAANLNDNADGVPATPAPELKEVPLNIIRFWPEGMPARLEHVWKDVIGFIPNYKLYDLQRVLAEFGFVMKVYEHAPASGVAAEHKRCDCAAHSAADCVCGAWSNAGVKSPGGVA